MKYDNQYSQEVFMNYWFNEFWQKLNTFEWVRSCVVGQYRIKSRGETRQPLLLSKNSSVKDS